MKVGVVQDGHYRARLSAGPLDASDRVRGQGGNLGLCFGNADPSLMPLVGDDDFRALFGARNEPSAPSLLQGSEYGLWRSDGRLQAEEMGGGVLSLCLRSGSKPTARAGPGWAPCCHCVPAKREPRFLDRIRKLIPHALGPELKRRASSANLVRCPCADVLGEPIPGGHLLQDREQLTRGLLEFVLLHVGLPPPPARD